MAKRGRTAFIIAFLSPAVLLYGVFVVWPLLQSFYISMFRWKGVSAKKTFVGAENFTKLAKDETFHMALTNNLTLLIVGGLVIMVLSILIAHAMQSNKPAVKVLKSLYLFPQVMSLVVVALIWQFIYDPGYGLWGSTVQKTSLEGLAAPLASSTQVWPAIGIAFVWYSLGFYIMLFSTGLKQIPEEINEAAHLDGSGGWHRFWKVTWPLLWSVKRIASIYIVINVLNLFALVWIMREGGPNHASETLLTMLYRSSFRESNFGYGTAIAITNFALAMVLAGILAFVFRKNPVERRT